MQMACLGVELSAPVTLSGYGPQHLRLRLTCHGADIWVHGLNTHGREAERRGLELEKRWKATYSEDRSKQCRIVVPIEYELVCQPRLCTLVHMCASGAVLGCWGSAEVG